ncbi:hypothetical protein SAMN04489844_0113 [Nocardioides exalbidus]|uniref:Dolichyl-phosphate-mannose-protein mannosyltransferase n=1 Tax=Nocardioides exalbidus TaxID=402596 RepID=A0A1H4JH42_9ACTN|nr:hypothetical protein [Nocardioides exalbidus]SEB44922.1 hypothetical protein SAMN04489844_0113 [Nocardioides exalbidus]
MLARDVGKRLGRANALVIGMIVVLSGLFVGMHVHGYTTLSPVDELQHIDYLDRAPGHPEPDDRVGQYALHQQVCRGIDAPGFAPPGCVRGRLDPKIFQESGFNTAAIYTPLYYTVTKVAAGAISLVTPLDDLVTTGRLAGAAWLALGAILVFAVGRRRGLDRGPLAALCALLVSAPALLYPSSTIAPDASALAAGAGLLLALTWWEERPSWRRAALLVGLAAVVALVKLTYLCVVAVIALYLLIRWVRDLRRGERAHGTIVVAVAGAVTALVAAFAWTAYVATLPQITEAELPTMATQFKVADFPWAGLADSIFVLVQPFTNPWVVVGNAQLTALTCTIGSLVLTSGTVAAAVFGVGQERERDLARATLVGALVTGAGLVVMAYVTSGSYVPIPSRYGAALAAPLVLSTAACVRSRSATAILAGLAAVSVVLTFVRLVGIS